MPDQSGEQKPDQDARVSARQTEEKRQSSTGRAPGTHAVDEEEVEDPMMEKRQKYGGNKGDIPDDDRKKKGHYGRGQKRKETAEEEGEINKESVELSEEDDIVAEVAKRVAARLQQDDALRLR